MVDKRLRKYYDDACCILNTLGIEFGPIIDVSVNTRAKSRWGQCRYNNTTKMFSIEISSVLLEENVAYKDIMDTMLHELLHCNTKRLNHTGEWKRCANLVNLNYDYNIKRATTAAEKNIDLNKIVNYKYIITCNDCGSTNKYVRKSKIVRLLMRNPNGPCRCGICNGQSFTVEEI